ncbi:metallophosphoesterase family protein [Bacillus sp. 1P06AnD]|uniref:metallophosphoesterase family protein n=1 Tax=Bacillus sp. 1P06AnD TaxID=3132208 RepID=UPI0039A35BB9
MEKIKFIHSADLHLDSPFAGLKMIPPSILEKMKEAVFLSFQRIVELAISKNVDFLLLAGDLYDGANRNLRTQVRFRKEMERLQAKGIEVYIIHGNHDHLGGDWVDMKQPGNVHIFSEQFGVEVFVKNNAKVHLYGYSYPTRHVKERIIQQYRKEEGADYHIGLLHGNLQGQTEHGQYAPFTLEELQNLHFDYWALGHIHKRKELLLSPPIIYPGNIQGRNRKESGPKGCYYVELDGKQSSIEFNATSPIVWEDISIELKDDDDFDQLLSACREEFQQKRNGEYDVFATLDIVCYKPSMPMDTLGQDLLAILQEEEEQQPQFVFPVQLRIIQEYAADQNNALMVLIRERGLSEQDVDQAIRPLYKHQLGRKYLSPLLPYEKKDLEKEAEQLLSLELSHGGQES